MAVLGTWPYVNSILKGCETASDQRGKEGQKCRIGVACRLRAIRIESFPTGFELQRLVQATSGIVAYFIKASPFNRQAEQALYARGVVVQCYRMTCMAGPPSTRG